MAKTQSRGNGNKKKKPSTAKKSTGTAARKSAKTAKAAASNTSRRQVGAIVLFAIAVLLLFVLLIPGGNVWAALQGFIFGLFGVCAYVWPFILIYVAIMTSLEKDRVDLRAKILEATALIILICAAVHIFAYQGTVDSYSGDIGEAYRLGLDSHNGGAIGAIVGGILLVLFASKIPAGITIILLIFVMLLVTSGTTLAKFFKDLYKPVKKVSETAGEHFEERARLSEERRQRQIELQNERFRFDPDVDLGPEPGKGKRLDTDDITEAELQMTGGKRKRKGQKADPKNPKTANIYAFQDDMNVDPVEDVTAPAKAAPAAEKKAEVRLDDIVKKAAKRGPEAAEKSASKADAPEPTGDPTLASEPDPAKPGYQLPPLSCLKAPSARSGASSEAELRSNAQKLVDVLQSFGVKTTLVDISRGPSVTRYELAPAAGVKISRITGLADDIALNLASGSVRIEAPIPNKAAVGIEVPNRSRDSVTLREILESTTYQRNAKKSKLSVALGLDITGNVITTDISKLPHLLVAGTTGSGKSVCMNGMILSLLFNATPDEVKLIMIDPKQVEFSVYNGIPHLLVPVVSDPHKAAGSLAWAVKEMLNRYKTFAENNVRDIKGYNELADMEEDRKKMPHIVIFIDELADLMMASPAEVEDSICRLAQMARAAGMHLVIATQRPSVDVFSGLIKSNIPSRLSLKVSSGTDSRVILDMIGAEKLLGNGDMLFNPVGNSKPVRIQGAFTTDKEVADVVKYLKKQSVAEYSEEILQDIEKEAAAAESGKKGGSGASNGAAGADDDADALLPDAIQVVIEAGMASTTLIQRKLKVGYARAARIIDELEERGVIGGFNGSKPREVLMTKNQWLEMNAMSGDEDDGTAAAIELGTGGNDIPIDEDEAAADEDDFVF